MYGNGADKIPVNVAITYDVSTTAAEFQSAKHAVARARRFLLASSEISETSKRIVSINQKRSAFQSREDRYSNTLQQPSRERRRRRRRKSHRRTWLLEVVKVMLMVVPVVLATVWAVTVVGVVTAVAVVRHAATQSLSSSPLPLPRTPAISGASSCTRTTSVPLTVTSGSSTATTVHWPSAFDFIPLSAPVLWTDPLYVRTRTIRW